MAQFFDEESPTVQERGEELLEWVTERTDAWRDYREQNYRKLWDEYERLWRGKWAASDKMRDSERSRVISPAIQQALETHVSEVTEAVFGFGKFFDITAKRKGGDPAPQQPGPQPGQPQVSPQTQTDLAVEQIRAQLTDDLKLDGFRKRVEDCIFFGGLFGNGIAEIVVKNVKQAAPQTKPIPGSNLSAFGVEETPRVAIYPRPIRPQNFLIDPNATSIDDALGCAIEEPVSVHLLLEGMEEGVYRKVEIAPEKEDQKKDGLFDESPYGKDFTYILKYYGKVPKKMLEAFIKDDPEDEVVELFEEEIVEDFGGLVEAIVVICNGKILKAVENPYMMKDRPVVAYQDDTVPGRFVGRGVVEKGYNMQKALDAQLRAHLDGLALTTAPMMGMDASRLPRGMKFEVKPGKSLLTNGNPSEILHPFQFGQTNDQNAVQAREFERMLLQATGTVDASGLPSNVSRDTTASGMSMALSALIKKNKRTLVNFQEQFLIPLIEKIVWRYMQFDPQRYPAIPLDFIPASSLGIMAREYEQQQYIGLMQTLGPQSSIVPLLLKSVIENSSVSNKVELLRQLDAMNQPNPEVQKREEELHQAQLQLLQAQAAEYMTQAMWNKARAEQEPRIAEAKIIGAVTTNLKEDDQDKNFKQRLAIADLMLKEEDIKSNERIAIAQNKPKEEGEAKVLARLEELFSAEEEIIRDAEGNVTGKRRVIKKESN